MIDEGLIEHCVKRALEVHRVHADSPTERDTGSAVCLPGCLKRAAFCDVVEGQTDRGDVVKPSASRPLPLEAVSGRPRTGAL